MNILMLTLMYPNELLDEVAKNAKDKLQNQINNYQRAFINGIRANLIANEKLDILNSLPVGIYPIQYRKLFLPAGIYEEGKIQQIGCINLPFLKQKGRLMAAVRAITRWVEFSPENRTVLVYTQYLPYMQALNIVKKKYPDLKVTVIVTDLPNELGLSTGRKGLLKIIESHWGKKSIMLLQKMDAFVFLTEPMAEALNVRSKPYEIIEGLILPDSTPRSPYDTAKEKPVFLYTGTLENELGIPEMLSAFEKMPEYELWICGHGTMQNSVEEYSQRCPNIRFFGFVPQQKALALQASATALINPRQPKGLFTRFSFPSKTLEYMRSGKPVLCCRLDGIPKDYDPYLHYMSEGYEGIIQAVRNLMSWTHKQREDFGNAARDYVLQNKNPELQCKKLLLLLRRL